MMPPKITETNLSDRNRMNDHNLDQRTAVTIRELKEELAESNLRLDLQINAMEARLRELKDRRERQENIVQGMEGLKI